MEDAKERLFEAAVVGDTEVLKQLADEMFSKRNDQGDLASHVALQRGHLEFAMKMCSCYLPALWERNGKRDGLLHMAAKLGHHEFFLQGTRLLYQHFQGFSNGDRHDERREDVNMFVSSAENGEGKSLLYVAAEKGYLEAAKLLLENKAYSNIGYRAFWGPDGSTALHIATSNRNYDMVKIFLEYLSKKNCIMYIVTMKDGSGNTVLHIAVLLNEPRVAELFLNTCPSSADILDRGGFSPLDLAVHLTETETDMVRILLQHVPESIVTKKDGTGNTPLHIAVSMNKPRVAETFLTTCSSSAYILNSDGFSPFHLAVHLNQTEMFQLFLRHCPRCCTTLTAKGQNALHIAVERNIEGFISVIVKDKRLSELMINQQDENGNTPFHLAVRLKQTEMLQLFLRHCTDCCNNKTLTDKGQNALHIAVERNIKDLISVIVEDRKLSELMINQQDVNDNTPLHLAAYSGDKKLQDTLLKCQVKVLPLRNKEGQTFQDVDKSVKERKQKEKNEKMQNKLIKGMEDFQSSLLVMATLIITVTFTAAFTLPGGYNSDQPNKGMATLAGRAGFVVFMVTNTISMCSSIVVTAALILFSLLFTTEKRFSTLKVAIGAIAISIIFMLVAFTAGVWLVLGSQHRWLAIFIAVITACTPLCLILLAAHIMHDSGIKEVVSFHGEK